MYQKKIVKNYRSWNSIPVLVDGVEYPSLFSACIDCEISYPNATIQMKKNKGEPFKVAGHEIIQKSWLAKHSEHKTEINF